MNIQTLLTALNNLESHNTRLHQYELRLGPDGSGAIFGVFKPQLPPSEAIIAVATMPQLYESEIVFNDLTELESLVKQMQSDPESLEWTLIEK